MAYRIAPEVRFFLWLFAGLSLAVNPEAIRSIAITANLTNPSATFAVSKNWNPRHNIAGQQAKSSFQMNTSSKQR